MKEGLHPALIGIQVRGWADQPEANLAISLLQMELPGRTPIFDPRMAGRAEIGRDPIPSSLSSGLPVAIPLHRPTLLFPSGGILAQNFVYSQQASSDGSQPTEVCAGRPLPLTGF